MTSSSFPDGASFVNADFLSKISTGKPGTYVLNSAAVSGNQPKYAVALSNCVVKVYDVSGKLLDEYVHDKDITDIKFCDTDPVCLLTSSLDGKLNVWDSRCQGPVQTFIDDTDDVLKPLLCFDYNLDHHLLCAGTEVFREDAFLLFWDRRTSEILGGYWNCHTDDITQIQFNPHVDLSMASSSVDGLINVFDLHEKTEADAVKSTLNIGTSVNKFCWKNVEYISCITSMEEVQIWRANAVSPSSSQSRETLSTEKRKIDYIIDNLKVNSDYFVAVGDNEGATHLWKAQRAEFYPFGYKLEGGHTDVVRTVCYNTQDEVLLTGGEDGCICFWKIRS